MDLGLTARIQGRSGNARALTTTFTNERNSKAHYVGIGTLKALHHAHRMIQNLKSNIHREKRKG
jgi:hypothetical protein